MLKLNVCDEQLNLIVGQRRGCARSIIRKPVEIRRRKRMFAFLVGTPWESRKSVKLVDPVRSRR